MADTLENAQLTSEWYFRRLTEKPDFLGISLNLDPIWWKFYWLSLGGLLVVLALAFIYWVYVRDSRAVGVGWGVFLAGLRTLTIASLFLIWLLPSQREKYVVSEPSRVVWLFDVSNSMHQSDDDTSDTPNKIADTRQDLVVRFLTPEPNSTGTLRPSIVEGLTSNNPVYFYRFGAILDPSGWHLPLQSPNLNRQEWVRRLQPAASGSLAEPVPVDVIREFINASDTMEKAVADLEGEAKALKQKDIADALHASLTAQVRNRDSILNRTNYGASVLDALIRETGKQVQALIIVGDGRSNEGSTKDLEAIASEARSRQIPIMTIGVGKPTTSVNVRLLDILAPVRIQPEDDFKVEVLVGGENYTGKEVRVLLHVEEPGGVMRPPMESTVILMETSGVQSSARVEFPITKPPTPKAKWPLGEFKFKASVGAPGPDAGTLRRIEKERVISDNKTLRPTITKVDDRKFSVLIMAGAPMRDYQFLRTMLVREQEKFETFVYFQPFKEGTVQDVDEKHLLIDPGTKKPKFPDKLGERNADPFNLGNYDLIVAFDVDWEQLSAQERLNLKKWNEDFGGGMIFVAGPVNTYHVARKPDLLPIRELLPVVLDGSAWSIRFLDRKNETPYALNWEPGAATFDPFNLTDTTKKEATLEGWEEYFWNPLRTDGTFGPGDILRDPTTGDAMKESKRGFFSVFPVRDKKQTGVTVLARYGDTNKKYYTDPSGPLRGQQQPMFVLSAAENRKGAVLYIGSAEIWRLRAYNEKFHERFWTKLLRFVGKGDAGSGSRRGMLVVGSRYAEGDTVEIEAQLRTRDMEPLIPTPNQKVMMTVTTDAVIPEELRELWGKAGVEMKSQHEVGREGWFRGAFRAPKAGQYHIQVAIPDSTETLTASFEVRGTDVERERNLPDFAALHRLASEVGSLPENKRRLAGLTLAVDRSKAVMKQQADSAPPGAVVRTKDNDRDRLFFTLENAIPPENPNLIPEMIDANPQEEIREGKITDLWDKGIGFLWMDHPELANPKYIYPNDPSDPSYDPAIAARVAEEEGFTRIINWLGRAIPWALLMVTLLLSAEWLSRKLLRLA